MTNKETFITTVLGLSLSLAAIAPVSLPEYDTTCMGAMREAISLNMNYSQDSDWQEKARTVNKCIHTHLHNSFDPSGDILVINLSESFENQISLAIGGGQPDGVILLKALMKFHYQSASNTQIERPTIITKLFGIKKQIIIDDTDTTYDDIIKVKAVANLIATE